MPSNDTTPAATLRAWQKRAHTQLAEFLSRAERLDLPPLTWTIAINGALTGQPDSLSYTPDERRDAVHRWARYLDVQVDTTHTTDGREELYAGWRHPKSQVRGCFRATIFLDDETSSPENQ
ncbi:hypothetical protein [Streptomyces sp. NPDC059076]|uniref:hypothetical protein n=1 Tax=unclassified Streptomyces TaxID=2593676 RepID=UPI0036BF1709